MRDPGLVYVGPDSPSRGDGQLRVENSCPNHLWVRMTLPSGFLSCARGKPLVRAIYSVVRLLREGMA